MKHILAAGLLSMAIFSCGPSEGNREERTGQDSITVVNDVQASGPMEVTTRTGTRFYVSEAHPRGLSLSDITIYASSSEDTIRVSDADPINSLLVNDLDKDGIDELYIATTSAGSGSYGKLIAVHISKDQRLGQIRMAEPVEGDEHFKGHMGKDRFAIDSINQFLLRTFPVYLENDVNAKPTGGERTIRYRLTRTGEEFQLSPVN